MEKRIKIGESEIVLTLNCDRGEYSAEFLGDGCWTFERKDVIAFASASDSLEEAENAEENQDIPVSSPDDAIVILWAMGEHGGTFNVSYYSPDSLYWAFHDIDHARNDTDDGGVYVDALAEDRALFNGAELARANGVLVADIIRELVRAESLFEARFGCPTDALDKFCVSIDSELEKVTA